MSSPPEYPVDSEDWVRALLQDKCKIDRLHDFQVDRAMDLIAGNDLFMVSPNAGKTIILFAPLLAAQAKNESGIAFIVVPTPLAAERMVRVFFRTI